MRRLSRRQRWATIALALVALAFLTLDLGGGSLRSAHSGVRGAFGSLYRGTDALLGPVRRFVQGVPGAASNKDRIDQLEAENRTLRKQLADAATDKATAARLSALQLAARSGGYHVLAARVTALSPGQGFEWTVTLNAGTSAGIAAGQTVTDGYGLVGRVVHADRSSSVVLLAVDPGSGVGVRDTRTGQLGMVKGAGTDGYLLTPLDPRASVRTGDMLVTGPAGASTFQPGLAVGTVRAVRASADGSITADVTPEASATGLDLVGVIVASGASQAAGR